MAPKVFDQLAFRERTRREVLQKSDLMPSLPDLVMKILNLLNDGGAELSEFEKLLRKDTTLVARMLRVVNSPFYGMARQITSIKEAVLVLGFRSLRGLVLAASTAPYLEQDFACYGFEGKGLWAHSLAVASGARTLAKYLGKGPETREETFVAGLLHDIGKILLSPYLSRLGKDVFGQGISLIEAEKALLGIDHQEAGEKLATKWNLTPIVKEVVATHHSFPKPGENQETVSTVRLSNLFAHQLGLGKETKDPGWEEDPEYQKDLELLGMDEVAWEDACEEMRDSMEAAISSLSNLGGG